MTKAQKEPDDMDEEELVRFYEERRGDMSLWQKKPRPIRIRRGGPSTIFALRLTAEELESLQRAAGAQDITVAEFVRRAALPAAAAVTK